MELGLGMNALNRLEAIRLAQQRIDELEQEISGLQKDGDTPREHNFSEKLAKLMKKFKLSSEEVIALLLVRGDLDRKLFSCETTYKLKHILGLKDIEASHSSEKPFRVKGWRNLDVE